MLPSEMAVVAAPISVKAAEVAEQKILKSEAEAAEEQVFLSSNYHCFDPSNAST